MSLISKNLGLAQAIHVSSIPPTNVFMIWLDIGQTPAVHKAWNSVTSTWDAFSSPFSSRPPVQMVFDDSLNALPSDTSTKIDGETVVNNDRVLVFDSSLASEDNKIFVATVVATSITWAVTQDGTGQDLPLIGDFTWVVDGTEFGGTEARFDGILWLFDEPHRQNTDIGTTSNTFDLGIGGTGVRLKNVSGELQLRNLSDTAYADLRVKDLIVEGTTTTVHSETVTIDDNIIELNSNVTGAPTEDGGIEIQRGTSTNASNIWDETADRWKVGIVGTEEFVLTEGVQTLSKTTQFLGSGVEDVDFGLVANKLNDFGVFADNEIFFQAIGSNTSSLQLNQTLTELRFDDGNDVRLKLDTSGLTITDANLTGAVYAADYSVSATDRWLTDKAYVDSGTSIQPYIFGNGVRTVKTKDLAGAGQVTMTNASPAIVGVGSSFTDATTGTGFSYWLKFWVTDSGGAHFLVTVASVTNDTNATISKVYNETDIRGGYATDQGANFPGITGTYDYEIVRNHTKDLYSLSHGAQSYSDNFSQAFGDEFSVATGKGSFAHGDGVLSSGFNSTAFTRFTQATGDYSFAGGDGDTLTNKVLVSGQGGFGYFEVTSAQTAGHGVLGQSSAILGGRDGNIPADANRVVILGGDAIKADATVNDMVYVPALTIMNIGSGGNSILTSSGNTTRLDISGDNTILRWTGSDLQVRRIASPGTRKISVTRDTDGISMLYNHGSNTGGLRAVSDNNDIILYNNSTKTTTFETNSGTRLSISDTLITSTVDMTVQGDMIVQSTAPQLFIKDTDNTIGQNSYIGNIRWIDSADALQSLIGHRDTGSNFFEFINIATDGFKFDVGSIGATKLTIGDTLSTFTTVVSGVLPTASSHLATKEYVDRVASSDTKDSVRLATIADITLSGEQTIDGFLTSSDRVLAKNQIAGAENGIYVTASGAWVRSDDADDNVEVTTGMTMWVEEGTANGASEFTLNTTGTIVVGSTALTFVLSGGTAFVGGRNGLKEVGNFLELGGTLLQATTISGAGFLMNFDSTAVQGTTVFRVSTTDANNDTLLQIGDSSLSRYMQFGKREDQTPFWKSGASEVIFRWSNSVSSNIEITGNTGDVGISQPLFLGGTLSVGHTQKSTATDIELNQADRTSVGSTDSGVVRYFGKTHNGTIPFDTEWQTFIRMDNTVQDGTSDYVFQSQIEGGGYGDRLIVGNDGTLGVGVAVDKTNNTIGIQSSLRFLSRTTGTAASFWAERTDGVWGGMLSGSGGFTTFFEFGGTYSITEAQSGDLPTDVSFSGTNIATFNASSGIGFSGDLDMNQNDIIDVNDITTDRIIFANPSGTDPILFSNSAVQLLSLTGQLNVSAALNVSNVITGTSLIVGYTDLHLGNDGASGINHEISVQGSSGNGNLILTPLGIGVVDINGDLDLNNGDIVDVLSLDLGSIAGQQVKNTAHIQLTQAQIQAINTTPIEIIAAPGANKYIQIDSASAFLDHNGTTYATATVLRAIIGSDIQWQLGSFIDEPTDATALFSLVGANPITQNTSVRLSSNADATNNGGTIDVYMTYTVIDTTL